MRGKYARKRRMAMSYNSSVELNGFSHEYTLLLCLFYVKFIVIVIVFAQIFYYPAIIASVEHILYRFFSKKPTSFVGLNDFA